jgi:acetyl-CoA decarbonylase/synthase complex subunit gamma
MNIFTDPQRPMATSEGICEIGGPNENSPVLITSNFSLTYFIVSGRSRSRYPLAPGGEDTGLSVRPPGRQEVRADLIAPS